MDVQNVVLRDVAEIAKRKRASIQVSLESALVDDLAFSSLNLIHLLTSLCNKCGVDIARLSDVELARMKTVGDVATILQACKASQA